MNDDSRSSACLIRGLKASAQLHRPRFVALGSFDGLHIGHRALLKAVSNRVAEEGGGAAVVLSFYPHPAVALGREAVRPPLISLRQRLSVLKQLGIDALIMLRFTRRLSQLSAAEFISQILVKELDVDTLFVGPDAALGRGREADVGEIERLLALQGRRLVVVAPVEEQGVKLGSRSIRDRIARGDLEEVERLLVDSWLIQGRVVRGDGRGKSIAIPTANISTRQLLPAVGVYCGLVWMDGVSYPAVVNVGNRPTFQGQGVTVEAHLYTWSGGDFYGEKLSIELHQRLREERRFDGVDALVAQIRIDIEKARERLAARNLARVL